LKTGWGEGIEGDWLEIFKQKGGTFNNQNRKKTKKKVGGYQLGGENWETEGKKHKLLRYFW